MGSLIWFGNILVPRWEIFGGIGLIILSVVVVATILTETR